LPVPAHRLSRDVQRTSVLLPVSQRESLQRIADEQFVSLSDAIRQAINEKLAREQRDEAADAP
jgi:Arc/MetJ-type ribon-helix-helix transcriptional regulator